MRIFYIAKVDIKFTSEEYRVKHKYSKQLKYQNWSVIRGNCLSLWIKLCLKFNFTFANILPSFTMISFYIYLFITQFLEVWSEIFVSKLSFLLMTSVFPLSTIKYSVALIFIFSGKRILIKLHISFVILAASIYLASCLIFLCSKALPSSTIWLPFMETSTLISS